MTVVTKTQLENASLDAESLAEFVNDPPGWVTTRTGETYKNLAKLNADFNADLIINDSIIGLTMSPNPLSGSVTVDVSPGTCRDKTGLVPFDLNTQLSKNLNGVWAYGSGMGGLDEGASAAGTWYNFFLIYNPTSDLLDGLFSTSFNNPKLPAGFTLSRYLGSVKTDPTLNDIRPFINIGEWFWFKAFEQSHSGAANGVPAYRTIAVPRGAKTKAHIRVECNGANDSWLSFRDPDRGDYANSPENAKTFRKNSASAFYIEEFVIDTDNLARIFTGSTNTASEIISIQTNGWAIDRSIYR